MKLRTECVPCLMEVAAEQAKLATDDQELQLKALAKFSELLESSIPTEVVPAYLGSERDRIISEITSNPDPCAGLKKRMNEAGAELKPLAEKLVNEAEDKRDRLKRALKVTAVGNSMEFGVSGHAFDPASFQREFEDIFKEDLGIDDSDEIVSKILSGGEILYLTDNCGEILLDLVLMSEVRDAGADLFIGAKSGPTQEDVTLGIAKELGIDRFGELISMGTLIGIYPDKSPREILDKLESVDLIISKGMGNYEAISEFEDELKGRLVYLLRAKCNPVASNMGVEKGALVAKLV